MFLGRVGAGARVDSGGLLPRKVVVVLDEVPILCRLRALVCSASAVSRR